VNPVLSHLTTLLFLALAMGLGARPVLAQFEALPPLSTIEPLPSVEGAADGSYLTGPTQEYFDLDAFIANHCGPCVPREDWCWQLFPSGIIYQGYLADPKESRLGTQVFGEETLGTVWDSTLGGHVGILRMGTVEAFWPQGWQLDLEGSGQVRLDPEDERDLQAADFRVGLPLTYGYGPHRLKIGYYHLSSHTGDEFLVKHPGFERVNYVRDVLILGYAVYWTENLRLYAETGWAFYADVSQEWEFRFGFEYAPSRPTGLRGAPFFAAHTHLREELNYSGTLTVQAGWAWRGDRTSHLFRTGLHYQNGMSNQFSFYDRFEHQIGAGMWYDF
jgi:hypothetical protein